MVFSFVRQRAGLHRAGKWPPRLRTILAASSMLALAACGGSPVATFNLTAPDAGTGESRGRGQLIIMQPVATAPYTSERLVVTTSPGAVAYLKGAQWSDNLPVLLQTRILQTFENSRLLRAVGRPGEKMVAALSLNSEIRRFDVDVKAGQAVIELSVKLINDASGRVVATRIFDASVPATSTRGPAAAAALDQALGRLLRELVIWTARRV